jgi:hypothetical protein
MFYFKQFVNNFLPFSSLLGLILSVVTSQALCGCTTEKQPDIAHPSLWQSHLKTFEIAADFRPQDGESIYVPIYSHIYDEDNTRSTLLTGTLSIRNTDLKNALIIKSIAYYSTEGKLLQQLCDKPVLLGPMATAEIVVPRTNTTGGSGANFIVDWLSAQKVSEPIAEAVMISSGSAQSVSFVSRGTVLSRLAGLNKTRLQP